MTRRFDTKIIDRARAVPVVDEIHRRRIPLRRVGLELVGACPVCGDGGKGVRSNRFAVHLRKNAWLCRRCERGGGVVDLVMHLDRIDFQEAIVRLAGGKHPAPAPQCALAQPMTVPPADDGQQKALKLWDEAGPIAGTLAEQYLTRPKIEGGRGLTLPPDISPRALRFHPRVWFSEKVSFGPAWHPCLLALYRNIVGPISFTPVRNMLGIRRDFPEHELPDEPRAVMRTALTPDGRKIGRAALGPVAGTAIKLSDDADVTTGLVIGEGYETTLAGMVFGFAPAWALGSAGSVAKFPVLSGIEALTILAETDDSGAACPANEQAIRKCFARWSAAGRDVYRATSTVGGDANDALMAYDERARE